MATLADKMKRPITVLLVEDNLADATLVTEAFKGSGLPIQVVRAKDGDEALQYLRTEGSYAEAHRPDLILLDLNMPKKSGLEVLQEIKSDTKISEIPVVVLTNSNLETDIKKAFESRANYYMVKPSELDELFKSMRHLEDLWLRSLDSPDD
jgi:chemotaxis family two-component system response regulator Rcp1